MSGDRPTGDDPIGDAPDHWAEYGVAGFTCWPEDGGPPISVAPTAAGRVEGTFPFTHPVCFVTAYNPGGPVIDATENDRRHRAFLADVVEHGWHWWAAVGGDPAGLHAEDGLLLLDASIAEAQALGARFEQDAIYVWRADAVDLLSCDGARHEELGWVATVGTTELARPEWA